MLNPPYYSATLLLFDRFRMYSQHLSVPRRHLPYIPINPSCLTHPITLLHYSYLIGSGCTPSIFLFPEGTSHTSLLTHHPLTHPITLLHYLIGSGCTPSIFLFPEGTSHTSLLTHHASITHHITLPSATPFLFDRFRVHS